jgi:hypothetical protein
MRQKRIHSAPNDHSDHDDNIEANRKGVAQAQFHDDFPSIEVEEQLKRHQEKNDHTSSHVMRRTDIVVNDELDDDAVYDLNPASAHRSTVDESFLESSSSKRSGRSTAALFLASDLSLVTGLERTAFFAALNNVSLLVLTGVGLMMVGNGDKTATGSGISMLVSALLCTVVATMLHIHRVWQIRNHSYVSYNETCIWITFVGVITFASLIFEIYFAILHPYLFREKVVTISTEDVI